MINDLEEALLKIEELENEIKKLQAELEECKSHKPAGRKVHDEKWMNSYHDFVAKYDAGMTIAEIVDLGEISRRTAYRYKSYYDLMKRTET